MPAGHGPVLTGSSLTDGVLFAFQTISDDENFNHNDQDYAKLVHLDIACNGKHCPDPESISGPRYVCSECKEIDLCATCVRDSNNGHDTTHKLFRCLEPPSIADPIIAKRIAERDAERVAERIAKHNAEQYSRDNDPGTVTQKGDPEVDLFARGRNEAGALIENILEARAAATIAEDESVLRERTVAI